LRASVGSTEAANDVVARFGVVGPKRAASPTLGYAVAIFTFYEYRTYVRCTIAHTKLMNNQQ